MGTILSVISGKGGTGKSTISAALGLTAAKQGNRVLLVDLDAGLGTLDLLLHMQDRVVFDLGDVLNGQKSPGSVVYACPDEPNLSLVCAPAVYTGAFRIESLVPVFEEYRRSFDLIILDLPAGLLPGAQIAELIADRTVVVATPDLVSVRDAQRLSVLLPPEHVCLLVNKVSRTAMKTGGLSDLDEAMDLAGLPLLGVIPFDPMIGRVCSTKQTQEILSAVVSRLSGVYVPLILRFI